MDFTEKLQAAVSAHSAGDLATADGLYREVLGVDPNQEDALRLLGLLVASRGDLNQAYALLAKSVTVKPDFAAGHGSLGLLLAEIGQLDESMAACRRALEINPELVDGHCGLGIAQRKAGDLDGAIASFEQAIKINANAVIAHSNLAPLLAMKGNLPGSISCYRTACHLQPGHLQHYMALARALRPVTFSEFDENLKADLVRCFLVEELNYRDLATPTVSVLKLQPGLGELVDQWAEGAVESADGQLSPDRLGLMNDELLLQLLNKCPVPDEKLERFLTNVRRALLERSLAEPQALFEMGAPLLLFLCSLAQQCFLNEYIYSETDIELKQLATLYQRVAAIDESATAADRILLAMYACYRPLHRLPNAAAIAGIAVDDAAPIFLQLLSAQVAEPLAEAAIRASITSILGQKDDITQAVQTQYEENPFPRWRTCHRRKPGRFDREIAGILPHASLSNNIDCDTPEILIAGCGTGLQVAHCALTYANARITAVDISLGSLAYAIRKTRELGIDNVEFLQANILELDQMGRQFDMIESFGVLHHLSQPRRGWEILTGLLKQGGLLQLGLYSELARQGVVASRELIADQDYAATPEGIRACRQALFAIDNEQIRESVTSAGAQFWTASEVRDLVFHESEYRYTVPELAETITQLGLQFLGFQLQSATDSVQYAQMFPDDPTATNLEHWHQYEQANPRTFANTYHFWLQK